MEGPVVLLALARRLSLEIAPGRIEPAAFTTLRPKTPVVAIVRPRLHSQAAAQ
jgi:hypothetical protein